MPSKDKVKKIERNASDYRRELGDVERLTKGNNSKKSDTRIEKEEKVYAYEMKHAHNKDPSKA